MNPVLQLKKQFQLCTFVDQFHGKCNIEIQSPFWFGDLPTVYVLTQYLLSTLAKEGYDIHSWKPDFDHFDLSLLYKAFC